MSNEYLRAIILEEVKKIEQGGIHELMAATKRFKEIGIEKSMHRGQKAKMDESDEGNRRKLEWYAGQLIEIADDEAFFCVNAWLNCASKFLGEGEINGQVYH